MPVVRKLALPLEADEGTRTPDPLLTMERPVSTAGHHSPSGAGARGPHNPPQDHDGQEHAAQIRPTSEDWTERELIDAIAALAIHGLVQLRQDDTGEIHVDL